MTPKDVLRLFTKPSTNDLKRRLYEHQSGNVRSTWNRRPLELVYYEVYPVKSSFNFRLNLGANAGI